ncbi:heme-binding protein [Pseudomonas sp. GD03944]|uniref:GlcG/HbpS family heme-binding protein n=1 Tax=Pseudomonas sp. GD03944 TaxID=2975409 RepID=UPI0024481B3F|nr:heme-binding protein [Pseudomonas sp. GD03944]MDH1263985.1 heme-binding protein [Pseudomonas sp. GD03944]
MTAPVTKAPPVLTYGAPIDLEQAHQVAAAAQVEALANGWPMVIAVADSGGHLVLLHKLDGAALGSVEVAIKKASTAALFKRSTKGFEETLATGGAALRLLSMHNAILLEGGIPLVRDGQVVGAIGVSGMHPSQDGQVAQAGAAVFG